jgi:hypothetical protein
VSLLVTIGLVFVGFLALLGTFSVIGRFSTASRVKASVLLLILTAISALIGPLYDMLLWTVVQCIVTVIWFLFYPPDSFLSGGVFGPMVLLTGVAVSYSGLSLLMGAVTIIAVRFIVVSLGQASPDATTLLTSSYQFLFAIWFMGGIEALILFWRRITERWLQGFRALKAIDAESR